MEKKVTNNFYILCSFNLMVAFAMGGGFTKDSLVLASALIVFVVNHVFLVKLVNVMTQRENPAGPGKILFLIFMKMTLLAAAVGIIYFYNKDLLIKLLVIMIFQLIIQLYSIKNNY